MAGVAAPRHWALLQPPPRQRARRQVSDDGARPTSRDGGTSRPARTTRPEPCRSRRRGRKYGLYNGLLYSISHCPLPLPLLWPPLSPILLLSLVSLPLTLSLQNIGHHHPKGVLVKPGGQVSVELCQRRR